MNGSRNSDGKVANGNWNPNYMRVRFKWNYHDNCNPNMGARVEVSPQRGG